MIECICSYYYHSFEPSILIENNLLKSDKMNSAILFLLCFLFVFSFLTFTLICGNIKCMRNTCVGSIYRFITNSFPNFLVTTTKNICRINDDINQETCTGEGGPCRYFVIIFFGLLYLILLTDYFLLTFPHLKYIYSNYLLIHQIFSFIFPCVPWLITIALQYIDPGEITPYNVANYLRKYRYDHVIYNEKICPTLHIPAVARSRYCRYTHKRIAKYDHYCPWVLAAIGEKTHKWFVFYLVSCVVASTYYCIDNYYVMRLHLSIMLKKIPPTYYLHFSKLQLLFALVLKHERFNACCIMILLVVILSLTLFIFHQIYSVSINTTQIEFDKYDIEKKKRKASGDNTPINNFYDRGVISNWLEFLFPTDVPSNDEPWEPDEFWREIIKRDEELWKKNELEKQKGNEQQTTEDNNNQNENPKKSESKKNNKSKNRKNKKKKD